jgi:predicted metalloprotease
MSQAAPLSDPKPRTALLFGACLAVLAICAAACAANTTGVEVAEQAFTTTTLPTLPGAPGDEAELAGAQGSGDDVALPPDFGPWSTADLTASLAGGGPLPLHEVVPLAMADIEEFWEREFKEEWDFGFVPVAAQVGYDSLNARSDELPECVQDVAAEFLVNAFYCHLDDSIAWDEGVLFPYLVESFGYLAAPLVLAHEYGHAIQARLGTWLDSVAFRADVVLELQADCYSGAWMGDLIDRGGGELKIGPADVDRAFRSVADLRDAPGSQATAPSAHGTSFDRMSAFREGVIGGIGSCVRYVEDLPTVTSSGFSNTELETLGNLPLGEVMPIVVRDLNSFWTTEFESTFGAPYDPPGFMPINPASGSVAPCAGREADPASMSGLVTYCSDGHVVVDVEGRLRPMESLGDIGATYPIIHAWGLQVVLQASGGIPPGGAILAGDCASGVWLRGMWEGRGELDLSPGDIDEAVQSFDVYVPTGPNGEPQADAPSLLDRVGALSRGFLSGAGSCIG